MQIYILALIPIILPPLIVLCIHWYNTLVSHLPAEIQTMVLDVAHVAVRAAEQSGFDNPTKKHLASDTVHTVLASFGMKIDPVYIDAAIESTVLALHNPALVMPPVIVPPVEVVSSAVVPIAGAQ